MPYVRPLYSPYTVMLLLVTKKKKKTETTTTKKTKQRKHCAVRVKEKMKKKETISEFLQAAVLTL